MESKRLTLTSEQWNLIAAIAMGDHTEKTGRGKVTLKLSGRDFEKLKAIFEGAAK